jgi:hypothetical protein
MVKKGYLPKDSIYNCDIPLTLTICALLLSAPNKKYRTLIYPSKYESTYTTGNLIYHYTFLDMACLPFVIKESPCRNRGRSSINLKVQKR